MQSMKNRMNSMYKSLKAKPITGIVSETAIEAGAVSAAVYGAAVAVRNLDVYPIKESIQSHTLAPIASTFCMAISAITVIQNLSLLIKYGFTKNDDKNKISAAETGWLMASTAISLAALALGYASMLNSANIGMVALANVGARLFAKMAQTPFNTQYNKQAKDDQDEELGRKHEDVLPSPKAAAV